MFETCGVSHVWPEIDKFEFEDIYTGAGWINVDGVEEREHTQEWLICTI